MSKEIEMINENDAIDFKEVESGIVQLTMQDRAHRNTLSVELVDGLMRSFELIKKKSDYKVVILTGYDNYFCTSSASSTHTHRNTKIHLPVSRDTLMRLETFFAECF